MPMGLIEITDNLVRDLHPLRFQSPVTHVYNPLEYARKAHEQYVERFGAGRKAVVLLGMNPGPWGMAQTGVPFGEVRAVRDWLRIKATVDKPATEHPRRPVLGFSCPRSEVSGARLWGWARDTFDTPERFFRRFFVLNYCALVFLEESGRNRTPDRLPAQEREALFAACDRALRASIAILRPGCVVGVGRFAETRARHALTGTDVKVHRILHPSPASPAANRGWAEQATMQLRAIGVELP
jgi:single-strand selective monofunctional uracil DNA glycosylase